MNPQVDTYLIDGCGRCPLGGTPQCKVHNWQHVLEHLRMILLDTGLTEELKWKVPCYTYNTKNILLLAAFKKYCSVSFFKGTLLNDTNNILSAPGENSQSTRMFKFYNVEEVLDKEFYLRDFIKQAIVIEKSGKKIDLKAKNELVLIEELQEVFEKNPDLKAAFNMLTPGRKRAYNIYFSQPKQAKTRYARIERYTPRILDGKGPMDR